MQHREDEKQESFFDKKIIAKNFSSKSFEYEKFAIVQKNSAEKLSKFLKPFLQEKQKILDLGSGTSFIAKNLANQKNIKIFEIDIALEMLKQWSNRPANVFAILSDIENLPFKTQSFDLIISSFSLQWIIDFENLFKKLTKILKTNGVIAFCLPVENSFEELRDLEFLSINEMPNDTKIQQALLKSGFLKKFYLREKVIQDFQDPFDAIKHFKKIGANNKLKNNSCFTNRNFKNAKDFLLKNLHQKHETGSTNSGFSVSYFISYFIFQKNDR